MAFPGVRRVAAVWEKLSLVLVSFLSYFLLSFLQKFWSLGFLRTGMSTRVMLSFSTFHFLMSKTFKSKLTFREFCINPTPVT